MSSIANTVFEFAQWVKSQNDAAAAAAVVLPSRYHEIGGKDSRYVRVWDVTSSEPRIAPNNKIKEFNAVIYVEFIARPESLNLEDLLAARDSSSAMALEFAQYVFDNTNLRSSHCNAAVTRKTDGWGVIGSVKYPVSYLLLKINQV